MSGLPKGILVAEHNPARTGHVYPRGCQLGEVLTRWARLSQPFALWALWLDGRCPVVAAFHEMGPDVTPRKRNGRLSNPDAPERVAPP